MSSEDQAGADHQHVTVVVTRTVKPGREQDYEAWLHGVGAAAHAFPGHMGLNVLRPKHSGGREYTMIFRFDTVERLRAWQSSAICKEWVKKADEICVAPAQIQQHTGMEAWFSVPELPQQAPPPRYKMATVTWLAAFPLIQLLNRFVVPQLGMLPTIVRGAIVGALMVFLLTYVIMPRLSRWFAFWLYPTTRP